MASPWWQRALRALGAQVITSVPEPSFDRAVAARGGYIFVANDHVSPMADVLRWLEASFDMTAADAAVTMAVIHNHGYTTIGPLDSAEAQRRVMRAQSEANKRRLNALSFGTVVPPDEELRKLRDAAAVRSANKPPTAS